MDCITESLTFMACRLPVAAWRTSSTLPNAPCPMTLSSWKSAMDMPFLALASAPLPTILRSMSSVSSELRGSLLDSKRDRQPDEQANARDLLGRAGQVDGRPARAEALLAHGPRQALLFAVESGSRTIDRAKVAPRSPKRLESGAERCRERPTRRESHSQWSRTRFTC